MVPPVEVEAFELHVRHCAKRSGVADSVVGARVGLAFYGHGDVRVGSVSVRHPHDALRVLDVIFLSELVAHAESNLLSTTFDTPP